jgi:hypothetical protein
LLTAIAEDIKFVLRVLGEVKGGGFREWSQARIEEVIRGMHRFISILSFKNGLYLPLL